MKEQNSNLLCIAPYKFIPAVNGGQKASEQLYRNVGNLVTTTVVSTNNNDATKVRNYTLIALFSTSPLHYINPFYFFKLKNIIQQNNITHLLMEHPYMGWLSFLLKKYTGVVWMIRSQNIEAVRFKTLKKWWWRIMWLYEGWVHQKADLSFFITNEDKQFAIENYHVSQQKCDVLTYGIQQKPAPSLSIKKEAKTNLCKEYNIPLSNTLLLFNGDLGYAPNTAAVETIVSGINPLLLQQTSFAYTILICGKNLPEMVQKQIQTETTNIIYTGFVADISSYFLAADIFINPVVEGGGIKTKLVEALGYNCSAVSTKSGAAGIDINVCNGKLLVVEDNDMKGFANCIQQAARIKTNIGNDFYQQYNAENIAQHFLQTLHNSLP